MDFDNGSFENGVDREPALELIKTLLEKGAKPESPNQREHTDPEIHAPDYRNAGMGGFHGPDAISCEPHGRAISR